MTTPYATEIRFTYENVRTICPWCGQEHIFNRVTDLRTLEPISCARQKTVRVFVLLRGNPNPT